MVILLEERDHILSAIVEEAFLDNVTETSEDCGAPRRTTAIFITMSSGCPFASIAVSKLPDDWVN
jgi:hypothetical protein